MPDVASQFDRKKITTLLLPVLAAACGYVVYTNFFSSDSKSPSSSRHKRGAAAVVTTTPDKDPVTTSNAKAKNWPAYSLDSVVGHSPFDPLEGFRPPADTKKSSPQSTNPSPSNFSKGSSKNNISQGNKNISLPGSISRGAGTLQAVLKSENGIVAIIDSKIVRPGDSINGVKIIAITPTTVFLENQQIMQVDKKDGKSKGTPTSK